MKTLCCIALGVGLLVWLAAARSGTRSTDLASLLRDLYEFPELQERASREEESLRQHRAFVQSRRELHRRILEEVPAGCMTLLEAAEQTRRVMALSSQYRANIRRFYPDKSEVECYGRYVIDGIAHALQDSPERAAVLDRLEADLHDIVQGYGPTW
jgi:hypothetical protein